MLNVNQINELLEILKQHNLMYISKHIGPEYLTTAEKLKLQQAGIDIHTAYNVMNDPILQSFYFGLISDAIGEKEAEKVTFKELKESLQRGEYLPMSFKEKAAVQSVKKQFLGDLKANEGRIFNDVNNIISQKEKNNRLAYEEVIREEILHGVADKKSVAQIASELGHKTGDWSRNFGRIVEYVSHQAFDEGRAALIERKKGSDAKVYKNVYEGACKHCVSLYLTDGVGSRPKIFLLTDLKKNGNNIGRKANEFKVCIGPLHPFCRCTLHEYPEGYDWNPETGGFTSLKATYKPLDRPKVKVTFNGKAYNV